MVMTLKEAEDLVRERFFKECERKKLVPQYVLYSIGFSHEEAGKFRRGEFMFHATHLSQLHHEFGVDSSKLLDGIKLPRPKRVGNEGDSEK